MDEVTTADGDPPPPPETTRPSPPASADAQPSPADPFASNGRVVPPPPLPAEELEPAPRSVRRPPRRRPRVALLRPLRHRDFALLWSGMAISLVGDGIYFVAIAWQVLQLENAAGALALVGVAWTAPQLVFLLLAGVMTDRFERRRVLILADGTRAVAIGALGVLSVTGLIELWHILVLVALYGTGDALFMPAFGAIVPDVVPGDELVEANSLDQFVRPLTLRFVGPAIGGLIVAVLGAGSAFLIDAGTFVVSALCIILMRHRPAPVHAESSPQGVLREMAEGFSFVRARTWLWLSLLAQAVGLLCFYGPQQVLIPIIVKSNLEGGAGTYGAVLAAGGVGAVIASILTAQRGLPRRSVTVMFMNLAAGTFLFTFFAAVTLPWQAMAVSFAMTATFTVGVIVWGTLIHKLVPTELLGRVSSFDWMVSSTLIPLSFAATGPVAHALGPEATIGGAGVLAGLLLLGVLLVPSLRAVEDDRRLAGRAQHLA